MNEKTELVPATLSEMTTWASLCAKSTLLPEELRGKEANVFVTIAAGRELGLSPMAALRSIHVVKGKPVLAADAMVAVVLASGKAMYFRRLEGDDQHATYETHRKGDPMPVRTTYSIADARRAGLSKDNWERHPAAMLRARAKSILARDVYPDILAGVYAPEEIDDHHEQQSYAAVLPVAPVVGVVQEAEVLAEEVPDLAALAGAITEAGSAIELAALLPRLQAVPKDHDRYGELRSLYASKRGQLQEVQP